MDFLQEDQTGMRAQLRVRWTLSPRFPPQPWIGCSGCGRPRPFTSSGKFRLNANGKKLDAWLIYRCTVCDQTWNRPVLTRTAVHSVGAARLAALQSNDPELVRVLEFDTETLGRYSSRIEDSGVIDVSKHVLEPVDGPSAEIEIRLDLEVRTSLRLDRCLATELGVSRTRLSELHESGRLRLDPDRKGALRRPILDGQRIGLELTGLDDEVLLRLRAIGP